jgi:D-glycero-D-manno-heptose 1,7-bisphosphate phosphatase
MGIGHQVKKFRRAIFLDQDGTLIQYVDLLTDPADVRLLPKVAGAIRKMNQLGFLVFIVTNQPVVARGLISENGVRKIERRVITLLAQQGASINGVLFCPHHPEATVKKYRRRCACRKPEPGMILKAARKYHLDLKKSFMIGDSFIDIVAGHRAGVPSILVQTGPGHERLDAIYKNEKPDFKAKNLAEAVKFICKK